MTKLGVIFDCDGTLVDSLSPAIDSFNYALERMGAPAHTPEQIKKFFGASGDRILTFLLGGERERGMRAFEHYKAHQTELAKREELAAENPFALAETPTLVWKIFQDHCRG